MNRIVLLFYAFVLVFHAQAGHAADDPVAKAMKLYEKRHYADAGAVLRAALPSLEQGRQGAAQLTLGMVYLRNAELHRALYQASLALQQDYLQKLASARGKSRSRYVDLYLGELLLEMGKPDPALNYLEKFAADESIEPQQRAAAKAAAGSCYALQKNTAKADEIWAGIDKNDAGSKAALAGAYERAGLSVRNPGQLARESADELSKARIAPSLRQVKDLLTVYASTGQTDKGLELAHRADLKGYSYRESMSRTKVISFYDSSLLGDLSELYLQAAVSALEKASTDAKMKETAGYYLGEAYAAAGNIDQSIKTTAGFIASSSMPQQYRDRATVRQAANQYQKGRQFDAIGVWDGLANKQPEDPDLLAEILLSCGHLRIDCPKVAQRSAAAAEAGEGKRYSGLNIALGRYYQGKKQYEKAVALLEAGRDKGNKNKIESNDPVMLVSLADAYYRTKKFSEALEIYFEMSKQFPQVRQIQEALQGIYSMEHKSAGDVKIN